MDLEKAKRALVNAHNAGDVEAARKIAQAIKATEQTGYRAAEPQAPQAAMSEPSVIDSILNGVASGMTFGFDDEIAAGLQTGAGLWGDYGKTVSDFRRQKGEMEQANPGVTLASEIAGGVLTGGGLAKAGATLVPRVAGKGLLTRMGAGAAEGAAYGGLYGLGDGEGGLDNRLTSARDSALMGAAIGGGIPAGGAALRAPFESLRRGATVKNAPTNDAIKQTAQQAYKAADDAGVAFAPQSIDALSMGIGDDLARLGYNPRLNPKVSVVLDDLAELQGKPVTLDRLEQLRRVAGNLGQSTEASDRNLSRVIIDNIDDFAARIEGKDMVAGKGREQAVKALQDARFNWRKLRKSEIIDEAFYKAEQQASGKENGLRVQFRAILNNKKLRRNFSPDEVKAIERVVQGGSSENALRLLGRFGFGTDGASNMLGGSIGAGAGAAMGGPLGAMAVPILGTIARKGAERATRSNADFVSALVRAGKIAPQQAPAIVRALESGQVDQRAIAGLVSAAN